MMKGFAAARPGVGPGARSDAGHPLSGAAFVVRARGRGQPIGRVQVGGREIGCALGRGGIQVRKREGDGATPAGVWRLVRVLYRADRVRRPITGLPVRAIGRHDGWCDEVADRNYNRLVRHPYPASAERLWRDDRLYDLVIVLDHNACPRVRGQGSAIFVHVAREGFGPTEGCVALGVRDLRLLLAASRRGSRLVICR